MITEEKKYSGVIIPMVTPINADLDIDRNAVDSIMKTFTINGVSAFLLGTTGESVSVPDVQKTNLVKWSVESAKNQTMIYAGISGNCLQESINAGNQYADLGVDVLVAHLPFYYPLTPEDMLRHFESLANGLRLPLVLYNNPATARWSLPIEVIETLSHHPNIVAIKDSERGLGRIDKSLELWKERTDFSYLLGWAAQSAYALAKGCNGIVPSTGNLVPDLYKRLYDAARNNLHSEAERLQKITDEIGEICQKNNDLNRSIPALKVMMATYGICQPYVYPPMHEIEMTEQLIIKEKTKGILEKYTNKVQ